MVGSAGAVVVDAVDMVIIRAAGAIVASSVFASVFCVVALSVSAVSVLPSAGLAATVSAVGVAVCSVVVVDDFCLPSVSEVSVAGVVVPELVSVGFGFSVVGSVADWVDVPDDDPSPETVVPEPPEALTDEVGPSADVVVVEPEVVLPDVGAGPAVDVSVPVVVVVVPEVPEVVVPEALPVVGSVFVPVSAFAEGSGWPSPVLADATP
jgi:hypothetical protein